MNSIWYNRVEKPSFSTLEGDIKTDVLVIGGGLAGLLCAHKLKAAGVDCTLVEGATVAGGTTANTTAKITLQHGLIYHKLVKRFGVERAGLYLAANREALVEYESLASMLDCEYEKKPSFVYSKNDRRILERELRALELIGCHAEYASDLPLPISTVGAVKIDNQAQLHPLKFAYEIAKPLNIYEHTAVRSIEGNTAVTERGKITAEKIIVATHFPFINKHGLYFIKMYQHRSYVISLRGAGSISGMYVDDDKCGLSFRESGDLLLLGGGSHRTGENGGGWQELIDFAKEAYPRVEITDKWAAQDCITLDGMAYIGKYSPSTPNLYVATGFNKWGFTTSMVAANILTDLILDRENPYAALFTPSRNMLCPELLGNIFKSSVGLLTPTTPRCTHLGCALKYNPAEHSWDCSCHGSRFDRDGEVLENPAAKSLKRQQ